MKEISDETENKSRRMKRIISQTDLSMSTAYPVCIYFSPVAGTDNLIKVAKNGIHREATGRHVKWTKVKKQRASHPGVSFFRVSFFTYFGWKLCNSVGHGAEPSIANNSKYVRGIACCFRFLHRGFDLRPSRHSHIGDISLAVQWYNLSVPGVHSHDISCCFNSHPDTDGG